VSSSRREILLTNSAKSSTSTATRPLNQFAASNILFLYRSHITSPPRTTSSSATMQFSTVALALLSLGSVGLCAPSPAQPSGSPLTPELILAIEKGSVIKGPTPMKTAVERREAGAEAPTKLSKRANCYNGATFYTNDLNNLGNYLQTLSGNVYMPKQSVYSWAWGSVKLCVYNNYVFENTHVSYWEMGWGLLSVKNQCCLTNICSGGLQQGHGDSGLAVNIVAINAGQSC